LDIRRIQERHMCVHTNSVSLSLRSSVPRIQDNLSSPSSQQWDNLGFEPFQLSGKLEPLLLNSANHVSQFRECLETHIDS
jgi:hypothetical protein